MQNPRAFVALAAERITADGLQWIELLPLAEKRRNGPWYFTITRDDLETYAADIRSRPDQIPVDYDHSETGMGTRAAGWLTGEAEVRESADGQRLWGRVRWTASARKAIEDGEWKFISPEWGYHDRDAKTGLLTRAKSFIAATLTNRPHFQELSPVATDLLDSEIVDDLADLHGSDAAGLILAALAGDTDTVRAAVWSTAFVNDLPDSSFLHIKAGGSKDGEGKTTPRSLRMFPYRDQGGKVDLPHLRNALARIPQADLPSGVKTRLASKARRLLANASEGATEMTDLSAIATVLGLPEDATEEQVTEAVKAAQTEAAKVPDLVTKVEELTPKATEAETLEERVAAAETALAEERTLRLEGEAKTLVENAVREFRVTPAQGETLRAQFTDNMDGLRAVIDASPPGTVRGGKLIGHGGGEEANEVAAGDFAVEIKGRHYEPSEDSLDVHARALKILGKKDDDGFTEDEYAAAVLKAEREARQTA